jgi:hypothetical protein
MPPQEQLMEYLRITSRQLRATNPRDKIFSLLGLVEGARHLPELSKIVEMGYENTVEEVYCKVAV